MLGAVLEHDTRKVDYRPWTPLKKFLYRNLAQYENNSIYLTSGSPLDSQKSKEHISAFIDKYTIVTQKTKSLGKPWEILATVSSIQRHLERAKAVTRFRLTSGHDFLGVYLHWLGLAANEACTLCGHARVDGDHLFQCTGLYEYPTDDIVSRYSEARRQMVKKSSRGGAS
ncbi:reverse transcriptase [Trichonephila clavipes]|nr:reverse transcriptase [Trichonephila clavipes]